MGLVILIPKKMHLYHWDSVDSTTWLCGSRFGQLHYFANRVIEKINSVNAGKRLRKLKNPREADLHNFSEWVKYQHFAISNL